MLMGLCILLMAGSRDTLGSDTNLDICVSVSIAMQHHLPERLTTFVILNEGQGVLTPTPFCISLQDCSQVSSFISYIQLALSWRAVHIFQLLYNLQTSS